MKSRGEVRINIGWRHFQTGSKDYVQVKSNQGGGTVIQQVPRDSSYENLLEISAKAFFPGGKSSKGNLKEMEKELRNFQGQLLDTDFSLEQLYAKYGSRTRIYLFTKQKAVEVLEVLDSDTSPSSDLPDPELDAVYASVSNLAGTSSTDISLTATSSTGRSSTGTSSTDAGQMFVNGGTPTVAMKVPTTAACTICLDRQKTSFLIPCGHAICAPCGNHFFANDMECPFCKAKVNGVGNIYS